MPRCYVLLARASVTEKASPERVSAGISLLVEAVQPRMLATVAPSHAFEAAESAWVAEMGEAQAEPDCSKPFEELWRIARSSAVLSARREKPGSRSCSVSGLEAQVAPRPRAAPDSARAQTSAKQAASSNRTGSGSD